MTPRHLKKCVRCGTLPRVHYSGAPGICHGYVEAAPLWMRATNRVLAALIRGLS